MRLNEIFLGNFEMTEQPEILNEMPMLIPPTDFQLNNDVYNRKMAADLLTKKKEIFEDNDNFTLFMTGDGMNGYIVLYLKRNKAIGYLIKYNTKFRKIVGLYTVTQVALWRKAGKLFVPGITKKVFFDILLPKFGAIMSDGQQTEYGMNFWKDRMAEAALSSKYEIGLADFSKHEINWWDKNSNFDDWLDNLNAWTENKTGEYLRFVIKTI